MILATFIILKLQYNTTFPDDKMLAVGIGHEVILVNSATKKSYKFGKQGNYPGQLQGISSVAFSSVGNILVADYVLNRVSMFSSEGEFILCFGTSSKNVRYSMISSMCTFKNTCTVYLWTCSISTCSYCILLYIFTNDSSSNNLKFQ